MIVTAVKKALAKYPQDAKEIIEHLEKSEKDTDAQYAFNLIGASLSRQQIGHGLSARLGDLSDDFRGTNWDMSFWNPARSAQERILAQLQNRSKIIEGDTSCRRCPGRRLSTRVLYGRSDEAQGVRITCADCGFSWKE